MEKQKTEEEKLRAALAWILNVATLELEHDSTLRARGARTLNRIADKVESTLLGDEEAV